MKTKFQAQYLFNLILLIFASEVSAQNFSLTSPYVQSDAATRRDQFGFSSSLSDNFAFVGSPGDDDFDDNGYWVGNANPYPDQVYVTIGAGAVYVLKNNGANTWIHHQKLVASDRRDTSNFGFSSSVDGDLLAVSAPLNSFDAAGSNRKNYAGAVYIFELQGDNWVEIQKIVAPDRATGSVFGVSVSLKDDILFVGSPMKGNGVVYMYTKNANNTFSYLKTLTPPTATQENSFGIQVKHTSTDLVVASRTVSTMRILQYDISVNHNLTKINSTIPDLYTDGRLQTFGLEENRLVVGETDALNSTNCSMGNVCGAVTLYEKNTQGTWTFKQKIDIPNGTSSWKIGYSVDVSNGVVGANSTLGNILVFTENNGTFSYVSTLKPSGSSWNFAQQFDLYQAKILAGDVSYYTGPATTNADKGRAHLFISSDVVSAMDVQDNFDVKIFPNPTNEYVQIDYAEGLIRIFDLSGKKVLEKQLNNQIKISLNELRSGLYLLKIFDRNGHEIQSTKLVKM